MVHVEKVGIYLSKPITYVLVLIYLAQSGLLIYLVHDKYTLERTIGDQHAQIEKMQEKLRIFKVIDDFRNKQSAKQ